MKTRSSAASCSTSGGIDKVILVTDAIHMFRASAIVPQGKGSRLSPRRAATWPPSSSGASSISCPAPARFENHRGYFTNGSALPGTGPGVIFKSGRVSRPGRILSIIRETA